LCIGVGHGIVYPAKVNDHVASVAPSCDVQLVVNNSVRKPACRVREWRASGEIGPAIRDWVVLPRIGLSAGNCWRVVAAYEINLASGGNVAASRKAAHIRHVRARCPRVGCDIVNPSDVIVGGGQTILTPKHVYLVGSRIIDCGSHDCRLRHR